MSQHWSKDVWPPGSADVDKDDVYSAMQSRVANVYDTIAAFRAATMESAAAVVVDGKLYRLDASDTTSDDDGIAIIVCADGKRYKLQSPTGIKPTGLIHTPGGDQENAIWRSDTARDEIPRTATVSSIAANWIQLTENVAPLFFTENYMGGVSYVQIHNISKSPVENAWVYNQPSLSQLRVTDAADISGWVNGETIQLRDPSVAVHAFAIDISPMMQNYFGTVFRQAGVMCKLAVSMNDAVQGSIGISPTGDGGTLQNLFSFPDGSLNGSMAIIGCTELSPISNSNLIYLREEDGGAGTLQIGLASVFGIFV